MAFQFQKPLDVLSMQKRYEEKESRRAQKHVQKAQENSQRLQMGLGISRDASPTQICDVPIADVIYSEDANPWFDSKPLSINETPDMASFGDFPISTAPICVDGFGLALGHESLAWDVSSPNQCFNADLSSYPSPNEHEGSDTHEASETNTQSANSSRGDHSDRPGTEEAALACINDALHEAADGMEAPTAPIERREVLVEEDIVQADAYLSDDGVAGVQSAGQTLNLTSTITAEGAEGAASCIHPRAQSEESIAAFEQPMNPYTPGRSSIEVLIEARPPLDKTEFLSGCDYPTPSSDSYQAPVESAKPGSSDRKRTCHTALGDFQAIEDAADDEVNIPDGRHRHKRQRDAALTRQNTSESGQRHDGYSTGLTHTPTGNNPQAIPRDSSLALVTSPQSEHARATRPREKDSSSKRSQAVVPSVSRTNASSKPRIIGALRNQACTSCGVDRIHLMRLSQNIFRWAEMPDSESILTGDAPLSTLERGAIMLRLAVGDLRDYLLEPLFEEEMELLAHKSQSFHSTRARSKTAHTLALSTGMAAHHSDTEDGSIATRNTTHSVKDDNHKLSKARTENAQIKVRKPRGRPPRWTTDDEDRLKEYLMKGMNWLDIAMELNRSDSAVQKHAQIMDQNEKAWSKLEDRRLRAYMMEGMEWPEIAEKLKRPEHFVALHWRILSRE